MRSRPTSPMRLDAGEDAETERSEVTFAPTSPLTIELASDRVDEVAIRESRYGLALEADEPVFTLAVARAGTAGGRSRSSSRNAEVSP